MTNVASYSVRVRPLDLPESRRDEVVQTLGVLLDMDPTEINIAIDSNPGSRYDTVRVAQDVDPVVAGFLAEAGSDLPGVQVVVETQRTYAHGTLFSHILGYTGPISGDEIRRHARARLPPGRPDRPGRRRGDLRGAAPGHVRPPARRDRPVRATHPGDQHGAAARCRELTPADDRHQGAGGGREGPPLGDEGRQPEACRDHRHEPAERRDPGDGQRADLRQQPVLRRHRPGRVQEAPERSAEAARQPRDQRPVPTRLNVQARRRHRRPRGRQDHAADPDPDGGLPDPRRLPLPRLERRRVRDVQHLLRLRPLERHVLLPGGRDARDRPPRLLGQAVRLRRGRRASTSRPRSAASSRRTSGRSTSSASRSTRARSTSRASARATTPSRRSSS